MTGSGQVRDAGAAEAVAGAAAAGTHPVVLRHDGARRCVVGRHQYHLLHPPPVRLYSLHVGTSVL